MGGKDNFEDFTNSENPVFVLRLADNADKGIPLVNMIPFKNPNTCNQHYMTTNVGIKLIPGKIISLYTRKSRAAIF